MKQARAESEESAPYTHEIVMSLVDRLFCCNEETALAIGFFLLLTFGCLRFSDGNRASKLVLNRDTIAGIAFKSKSSAGPLPFAALRRTWDNRDWAGKYYAYVTKYLPAKVSSQSGSECARNWLWPRMWLHMSGPKLVQPVQRGSYSNCLMIHAWVHQNLGHVSQPTLHGPRFYLPIIAGQAGLPMDLRRAMGHWGPHSGMPVRYDQSRCCTELLAKQKVWDLLSAGFSPVQDFEVPALPDISEQARELEAQAATRSAVRKTKRMKTVTSIDDNAIAVLINNRSKVLHRVRPNSECRQTICSYVRSPYEEHYELTTESAECLHLYIRCVGCWSSNAENLEYPVWPEKTLASLDQATSDISAAATSSASNPGTSESSS